MFLNYMGEIVRAGAGGGIFDKLEPDKNGPALQHWLVRYLIKTRQKVRSQFCSMVVILLKDASSIQSDPIKIGCA
jgi:hypothetical protein